MIKTIKDFFPLFLLPLVVLRAPQTFADIYETKQNKNCIVAPDVALYIGVIPKHFDFPEESTEYLSMRLYCGSRRL